MPETVQITTKGRDFIKRGHIWVFANEFITKMKTLSPGRWVEFHCKNEFLGHGYANPHSLIAGRICSRNKVEDRAKMLFDLIKKSWEKRDLQEKSYRAVFSESDSLPGLIVDVYESQSGRTVVAQSTTAGMDDAKHDWVSALQEILHPANLVIRADSSIRHLEGIQNWSEVIKGDADSLKIGVVQEDDVLIGADFIEGQKTGFFIDQRENRRHLKDLVKKLKEKSSQPLAVLDLCCYSGGWGLSALNAGADHVTFVDQSQEALDLVERGLQLNKVDAKKTQLTCADVFEFLKTNQNKFDVIICDPPAFVKSKKNIPQAEQAYLRLNTMAIKALKPAGHLYTCSCSYHMGDDRFIEIVQKAFESQSAEGVVLYKGGQSLDHPWIINRPESKYLKCLLVKNQQSLSTST